MTFKFIIFPIIALAVAQMLKVISRQNRKKALIENLMSYSGMPSGHSALVVSLATIIGLFEGWGSPAFAVSFILAIIVIRDAVGIRRYLGQHGKTLNRLVKDLESDEMLDESYPTLIERIGHTPLQVLAGSLIGFLVSLIGYYIE